MEEDLSETVRTANAESTTPEASPSYILGAENDRTETNPNVTASPGSPSHGPSPLSKNHLKRLKRQAIWEEKREDRKRKRKEKRHDRQIRKRSERDAQIAEAKAAGLDPKEVLKAQREAQRPRNQKRTLVPVALILDCDFEEYMRDSELVSLASQLVRCYSQNRTAQNHVHLMICPWRGKLRHRFETVMGNTHRNWHGTHFIEGDFVEASRRADELMRGPDGGALIDVLKSTDSSAHLAAEETSSPVPVPGADAGSAPSPSVVYLTADSPHTLEKLEPYTSYIIGGIVDKNREKGICYKRAEQLGIKTAKLPIGQYMQMQSRQVLATNHVVEIMSKWLESGDWASAFLSVIPKRKGGTLRVGDDSSELNDACDVTETAQSEEPLDAASTDPITDRTGAGSS
ncbi:tRNA (Guanine-N(1)-)-methyltransferase [Pleurostoma richardsiae]|uniref:tRNA (guanine(9)-N1)-methyltransferase n=1 Tax=Pleurostoma richardsiae TaxID=41990 RepID=A0AA38RGZ9_9PEZI|nr:tRNA (Guanine-N(1)-)-methyltransferase [Pleurostoma richardsiae]